MDLLGQNGSVVSRECLVCPDFADLSWNVWLDGSFGVQFHATLILGCL